MKHLCTVYTDNTLLTSRILMFISLPPVTVLFVTGREDAKFSIICLWFSSLSAWSSFSRSSFGSLNWNMNNSCHNHMSIMQLLQHHCQLRGVYHRTQILALYAFYTGQQWPPKILVEYSQVRPIMYAYADNTAILIEKQH